MSTCKVTRLPTAAARKVDNYRYAEQRREVMRLRLAEDNPFRDRFLSPGKREAIRVAETISSVEQTPALMIAQLVFAVLDEDQRKRVIEALVPGAVMGSEPHKQALIIAKASRMTVCQQFDYDWAMRKLDEGG